MTKLPSGNYWAGCNTAFIRKKIGFVTHDWWS